MVPVLFFSFFFQAEDGIRDLTVTGVQTCALPISSYVRLLRRRLTALYPSTSFAFLPADMVSQILNFGLPAPVDVQVSGFNVEANRAYRSEEHTSELQSQSNLVCRLLLEKTKTRCISS